MIKWTLRIFVAVLPFCGFASASCLWQFSGDSFVLQDTGTSYDEVHSTKTLFEPRWHETVLSTGACSDATNISLQTAKYTLQYIDALSGYFTGMDNLSPLDKYRKEMQVNSLYKDVQNLLEARINLLVKSAISNPLLYQSFSDEYELLEQDSMGQQLIGLYYGFRFYGGHIASTFASLQDEGQVQEDTNVSEENDFSMLSTGQIAQKNSGKYLLGDTNAIISLIEYADIGCYACVNNFNNNTVAALLQKYGSLLNYSYKPVDIGYDAEYPAEAIMCAGKLKGPSAYNEMRNYIYQNSSVVSGEHAVILATTGIINSYAGQMGIDMVDFVRCMTNHDTAAEYSGNYDEAIGFAVDALPAFVLINNTTNQRTLMQGVYETGDYKEVIDMLLAGNLVK